VFFQRLLPGPQLNAQTSGVDVGQGGEGWFPVRSPEFALAGGWPSSVAAAVSLVAAAVGCSPSVAAPASRVAGPPSAVIAPAWSAGAPPAAAPL